MIPGSASSHLLGAPAGSTYQISRSLRFNRGDSASLSRTVSSASNRTTWTFSCWVKRTAFGENGQTLFTGGTDSSNSTRLAFDTSNRLVFENEVSAVTTAYRVTSAVYRDPSAWMHVVLAVDTTLATAADRVKLWVNGTQLTTFATNNAPTQNLQLQVNAANTHYIGQSFTPAYANFYLADVYFVDGLALTASNFGELDTNNVWQPKTATGITSYGTNGFRLTFADNSNTTSTTLGKDAAGSNNWTPSNFSVTAGSGNDSLVDSPTNYGTDTGAGGEVRGNYCTLNPISTVTTVTLANGNLEHSSATAGQDAIGTFGVSTGKWYWEVTATAGTTQTRVGVYNTAASTLYSLASNATVYGIRFDASNGVLEQTANGTNWTSIATGLTAGPYFPYFNNNGTTAKTVSVNFGQRPFAYTAPSGYKALCSTNLPTPTIPDGSTVMESVLYTGTGATLTPTSSLLFSPDLVWIKNRSNSADHALYDTVRGAQVRLESNQIDLEASADGGLTAFNSNGFTLGTLSQVNLNTNSFVAWCWDAGSSTVTNNAGTISSQVRVNDPAGFSVVTYTGNGVNSTVGHGLGPAPNMIIIKRRNGNSQWSVYHSSVGDGSYMVLNTTAAATTGTTYWNSTTPNAATFTIGTSTEVNTSTALYVAYCFNAVAGYSAFGSYVGNASTDGPFVYTGFRPRWIMVKQVFGSGTNWSIYDTARSRFNQMQDWLLANGPDAETSVSALAIDSLSNGFKLRGNNSNSNAVATYLYAAFAENPFSISRAR